MEGYHFGVMGDYRITEKSNSKKEIKKQLENITWNRIIQVVMILNEVKEKLTTKTENK
jgi:vacuolar-type H+-ATPase subunit F/Vma7